MIVLIHPPVAKPCEPPPGIAKLCGALNQHGITCRVVDANLEGLQYLLAQPTAASDKWSLRASRGLRHNLACLRSKRGYRNLDRYKRAVLDLNRLLEVADLSAPVRVNLVNYQHQQLSPVNSADLIRAAENPQENPFYAYFTHRLRQILETEQPSMVGLSLNFLSQALCTFAMIGWLRREHPAVPVVLGGGLVTSWLSRPHWHNPFAGLVDHLIAGPGEAALLSLLGQPPSPELHYTPDYSALPLEKYLAPGPILPYSASRGCYWNRCAFCPEKAEKTAYHPLSARAVTSDLRQLVKATDPVLLHLLDNALSPALMSALCSTPPGVPWYGFTRITRRLTDPQFCAALRRSGCVMLKLGLESGDQQVLDHEQKGLDLQTASLALKALHRAGIMTYVYLLFGTPSETLEAARNTLDFIVRHGAEIDFLNLAIFNLPLYAAKAFELPTRMLSEGDLSLYTGFLHPQGWHRGKVRHYLAKEFKRHPTIASILRREPPLFTSNHAAFFRSSRYGCGSALEGGVETGGL